MVSSRASLSIVELVYYIPALGLATWVASRHGFSTSSGWFFVILLALFRIVGSRLLISNDQNPNRSLRVAATILNIDGLSLLILVMLGLLKRVHERIAKVHAYSPRVFDSLGIPMLVGFILTTVGGVNAYRNGVYHPQTTSQIGITQIGITLYALVLGALSGITARTLFSLHRVRPGDRRLIYAIAAGIPFLIVRLIYSLISVYERSRTFDPVRGSVVVYALMGVAMEFIVVAFYLAAGLLAPVIPKSATQPGDSEPLTGTEAAYMPSQDAEQQGSAPRVPDQQAGISLNR